MADKQKYLDYDGTAILKNKILEELAEDYDNRLLATNYFNEINGFSTNSKYEASNFEFEDTANYNLVTMVFSSDEIVLTENLMCMISFKFYNANTNKSLSINKKILTSALTQDDEGIKYVLDATETGIGDYISTNIDNIDTIKSSYMYGAVSLCSIFNEDYDGSNIINGYNNIINGKEFVIVNGEDNTINTDTKYTHVSGSGNKIITNKYGMINGTANKIENNSYDLMIGNYNYSIHGNYKTILGTRNRLYFGTYIPRDSWSQLNADTSVSPVKLEITFSIASNYTWLQMQSALPKVGDMIGLHSYYGIRPTTVLEIDMDDTYLVRLKVNMVESSENDGILKWCETDIHGILIETIGYSKSNNFISGDFNSSFTNCSTIFGFGNSVSADYGFTAGRHNQVLAEHASALGWGNVVSSDCATVIGCFCKDTSDALFVAGNGKNQWVRSNALILSKEGKLTIADDLVYNGNTSLSAKIEEIGNNINSLSPVVYDCIVNESFASNSHIIVYENESIVTINVYLYTTEDVPLIADDVIISGLPPSDNANGGFTYEGNTISFVINNNGELKSLDDHTIVANAPIIGTYIYKKSTLNENLVFTLNSSSIDENGVITDFEKDGVSYPVITDGVLTVDKTDDGIVFDGSQGFLINLVNGAVSGDVSRSLVIKFMLDASVVSGTSYQLFGHSFASKISNNKLVWGNGHTGAYAKNDMLLVDVGTTRLVGTTDAIPILNSILYTLVSVYDKENSAYRIYLNGTLLGETTTIANSGIKQCDYVGNNQANFLGKIYEFSLYDDVLTDKEIASL